jgi:hypothetical protein
MTQENQQHKKGGRAALLISLPERASPQPDNHTLFTGKSQG